VKRRTGLLLATATVLALSARTARAAEVQVVEGKRVEVRSTVGDPASATVARDLLEKALETIEGALPYRVPAGKRVVVNLHATEEEYTAAVLAQGGSEGLARRWAATLHRTAESHVLVQPRTDAAYLARVGHLPQFTRFLLCHEAVHQVCYLAKAPGHEWWPTWYGEGVPNLLAERCLAAGKPGAEPPICVDDIRHLHAQLVGAGRALRPDRLLAAHDATFSDVRGLYAQSTEFVRALAADADRFRRLHERIRDLPPPSATKVEGGWKDVGVVHARACAEALEGVYGPMAGLAARWHAAPSPPPRWFETWRCSETLGDAVVTAAFPGSTALVVSAAPPPTEPFTFTAEVEILPIGMRQADVVLAYEDRLDPRFLKVAVAAKGAVTLLAYADGEWQGRYTWGAPVPPEDVPVGRPIPLSVEVGRERIRLFLRGAQVLDVPVPPGYDAVGDRWGLAARDTVAVWTKVAVKPSAKGK
jgi:hypothetical protein